MTENRLTHKNSDSPLTSTSFLSRRDLNLWRSAIKGLATAHVGACLSESTTEFVPTHARVHARVMAVSQRVQGYR